MKNYCRRQSWKGVGGSYQRQRHYCMPSYFLQDSDLTNFCPIWIFHISVHDAFEGTITILFSLLWHSFHVFTIWKLEKICFGFFRRVVVSSLDLYKFFNIKKWKIYNSTRPSLILWLQEARLQVKKAEYCVSHRVKKSSPSSETEKDREISRKNEQKTCVKVVRFERQPRIRKMSS